MHHLDWKLLNSEYVLQNDWFAVRADRCEMPNGRLVEPYFVIESQSYVNVVPVTVAGEILFVRLYRHGLGQTVLETPGGLIDAEESARAAARRELLEETGYACTAIQPIGSGSPDPARYSYQAYYFLATDVTPVAAPRWDDTEEMELLKLPIPQVKQMLLAGEIVDSVQQSALFYALHALGAFAE